MKKKILALIMSCTMVISCTACRAETDNNITVTVNGNAVTFDQPPIIVDGRTLVPIRAIFEALGASVDWNGDTQTVTSMRGDTTVSLTIGSDTMIKNGITYTLDVPAQIVNERTLVPARAIAEAFGCGVDWDGDTQTVIINENSNAEQSAPQAAVALNNTYTTRYGTVNPVTCPKFSFDYSDNWTVTNEEVSTTDPIEEQVTLTNSRGVEIYYMAHHDLGGGGRDIVCYEVTKVADSQFVPYYAAGTDTDYSYLSSFMVGEIKAVGRYDMKTGELVPFDGGRSYAVMPESYIGTHEATALSGFQEEFSFEYASNRLFIAEEPEGGFTEAERDEVIAILSSFRVIN